MKRRMDKTYKKIIRTIDIIMLIVFWAFLLAGCGVNEEAGESDTEDMHEPQMETDSEEISDIDEIKSPENMPITESNDVKLQIVQDIVTHGNPTMVSAYRELLEQEQFDWNGQEDYYDLANMKFSFITAEDDEKTVFLLLHNSQTYLAAGTEHILMYQDGEVKTIWGDGKNCIYMNGYTRSEDEDSYIYVSAGGGRQDATYSYLVRLSADQADDIALKLSYPDMSSIELDTREPDYIEQYYWMDQEIGQDEYQTNYAELNLEQMIDIEWIDNTERNREYVFEALTEL